LLVKALLAGEIDSYQAGPGATLIAASRGAALRIIGCSWVALPQAVFVRDGIASVADLRGKSLAISAPGAQADLLARLLLRKHGVAPEEVRFVDMGSDADRFKAVVAGKADAAISSVEFSAQADAQGVRTLLSARDIAGDLVRYCEVTSTEHAVKDRAWVVRFLAADIAAHRYALANRQAEIDLARKVTRTDTRDARAPSMYDFVLNARAVDANLAIPGARLAAMQRLLVETGNIAHPQDLTPLLADDINRAALARADAAASEPVPSGAAAAR
jgi:NitT/TauT family transport system substrate-binding protein